MHPNTLAALKAGRARWLEKMHAAKAAGVISRFPNGQRPAKLNPDMRVRKARQVILELRLKMSEQVALPKPRSAMGRGEKLALAADTGLDVIQAILDAPVDLDNLKLLALQQNTALTAVAMRIKVEQGRLSSNVDSLSSDSAMPSEVTIVVRDSQTAAEYERIVERARGDE
jgi:hypothetical protein